jgi:hypothetical protein
MVRRSAMIGLAAAALVLVAVPVAGEAQQGRTLARIGAFHVGDHLRRGLRSCAMA